MYMVTISEMLYINNRCPVPAKIMQKLIDRVTDKVITLKEQQRVVI